MKEKGVLYLACPFSHKNPEIEQYRYKMSCLAAAKLFQAGIPVFNPLANSVAAIEFSGIEIDHDRWMSIDIPILRRCDELLVLGLDGWTKSDGVRIELFDAIAKSKPVTLIEEADIDGLPRIPATAKCFLKSKILTH